MSGDMDKTALRNTLKPVLTILPCVVTFIEVYIGLCLTFSVGVRVLMFRVQYRQCPSNFVLG